MKDTKIILVDGMPGTGKSTVSQFIYLQLKANGQSAYWCHEEQNAHPVCLFYDPKRHRSEADYIDAALSQWICFVDKLANQERIAVLDGAFLQNHLRSMLIFACQRDKMLELFCQLEELLASFNPIFIYLKPTNIDRNFHNVVTVRGERMLELWLEAHNHYPYTRKAQKSGYPGFISFWEEFGDISDQIFEHFALPKHQLSVPIAHRGDHYDRILELLNLPLSTNGSSPPTLERYAGKYVPLDSQNESGFILKAEDGFLTTYIDQPAIDVNRGPIECFREVRLIPKEKNAFYVEAWPHEVLFTENRAGIIVNMRLSISQDGWEKFDEVYMKHKSLLR